MIALVWMLSAQAYDPFEPEPFFRELFESDVVAIDGQGIYDRLRPHGDFQELSHGVLAPDLSDCLDTQTPVGGGVIFPLDGEDGHWLVTELTWPGGADAFAVHGVAVVFEQGPYSHTPCQGCPTQWVSLDSTLPHEYAVRAAPPNSTGGAPTAGAQVWWAGELSSPNQGFNLTSDIIDVDGDGVVDPLVVEPGESVYVAVQMRQQGELRTGVPVCGIDGTPAWWVATDGRGWVWSSLANFDFGGMAPVVWAWGYTITP